MKKISKLGKFALCILACVSVILCAFLASCNTPEVVEDEKIEVIRAKEDLEAGAKITEAKVEKVLVSKADLPIGTITDQSLIINKFTTSYVYAGDYFFQTKLSNTKPIDESQNNKENENEEAKINFDQAGYIIVSDYVKADTGEDVAEDIQKLIDENPNRTLYFPDGVYMLSKSITTSADPSKTVSFKLSNYAQFKPADNWTYGEPLFKLGATGGVSEEGGYVTFEGGILNGENKADGIWVMNSGNVSIRYSAIRYVVKGIHVKADENGNGPTVDVTTVNITGNGTLDSIGVLLETDNNTLTNMRIAANQVAIKLLGNNNFLRNLHPLYLFRASLDASQTFKDSIAFYDAGTQNFYDNCYNDQFATGFYLADGNKSIFDCCFNIWYTVGYDHHTAFYCEGKFDAVIRLTSAELQGNSEGVECNFLIVEEEGGSGIIDSVFYYEPIVSERDSTRDYLINEPIID